MLGLVIIIAIIYGIYRFFIVYEQDLRTTVRITSVEKPLFTLLKVCLFVLFCSQ